MSPLQNTGWALAFLDKVEDDMTCRMDTSDPDMLAAAKQYVHEKESESLIEKTSKEKAMGVPGSPFPLRVPGTPYIIRDFDKE